MAKLRTKIILPSIFNMSRKSVPGVRENGKDNTEMFRLELSWGVYAAKNKVERRGAIKKDCESENRKIRQHLY